MLRNILIEPVLNGWIVIVGCQRVVFNSKKAMLDEISSYLDDPEGTQKRYAMEAVNAKHDFARQTAVVDARNTAVEEVIRDDTLSDAQVAIRARLDAVDAGARER